MKPTAKKIPTLRAASVEGLPELLRRKGVSMDAVLKEAQVSPTIFSSPDNRLSFQDLARVLDASVKAAQCDTIGIELAQIQSPKAIGKISYLIQSAETLGESLECGKRYYALHQEDAVIDFFVSGGSVTVTYDQFDQSILMHRQDVELTVALLVKAFKVCLGDSLLTPTSVHFRHPPPRSEAAVRQFFGCPVHFSDYFDGVKFPSALLSKRIVGADKVLFSILEQHCEEHLVTTSHEADLVERVRKLIVSGLKSGNATIEKVSAELALTARTLQRRLADEGVTFNELFDDTRKHLSCIYIRDERIHLAEMAYLLGYADLPSFHRAFKRWHGITPQQMRGALEANAEPVNGTFGPGGSPSGQSRSAR